MRKQIVLLLALLLPLNAACSGPPPNQTPDRPPSFEGIITTVQAADVSSGTIDVAVRDQEAEPRTTQRVAVANSTRIVMWDKDVPQTFDQLLLKRRVRVWLDTAAGDAAVERTADVIELDPRQPPARSPSFEGVITAVQQGNGDPWMIAVASGGPAAATPEVRRVTVNNDTRILKQGTSYCCAVGELVPQLHVRVWLPTQTSPSAAAPIAEAIELQE